MCNIRRVRLSKKAAYVDIEDELLYVVKKLPIDKFHYAEKFGNPDFINMVSSITSDRDFDDAWNAQEVDSKLIS